jgi:hypothetical protein
MTVPQSTKTARRPVQKALGALLAGACLLGVRMTWRTLTVANGMDEPITRLIVAGVPALATTGFGLWAAAAFAQRRAFVWWGLGCLIGAILYMSLLIAISSIVL